MKKLLAIAGLTFMIASCNTNYEKTKSGLAYKIFSQGKGEKLKPGQIVKINGQVTIAPKDSILFNTFGHLPEYLPFDTSSRETHDFTEVLKFAKVGDSMVVIAQVDTLVKKGAVQYNDFLKKGDQIVYKVKILGVFNSEEEKVKDQQMEMEKEKEREIADLAAYLKKNNITAQKTENGVFVQVIEPGTGPKVKNGDQISVNYTGSLLSTGKVFDSNVDTSFKHPEPFMFVTGTGSAIQGWEEGFQFFGKGGKGVLYIPAMMGYGPAGNGREITPYAALKFEVEVKDVSMPPAQPSQQAPPPPTK
jgi:FKBP-type peptidyl-prolyl cis-trans isomerase FkpA